MRGERRLDRNMTATDAKDTMMTNGSPGEQIEKMRDEREKRLLEEYCGGSEGGVGGEGEWG